MTDEIPPDQTADEVNVPAPVKASFWLWIFAGVLFVLGYVLILFSRQTIIDVIVKGNKDPKLSADAIASGITTLLWVLVLGSLVFAVLFALFAYKAREGTRSARTVLTVLVAVTLVLEFLLQLFSAVTLVAMLIALIALLLMYLPSVRNHFPSVTRKLL